MSLAPLDLLSAHPWQRVTFTTYALSLSFFEAVLLDRLNYEPGLKTLGWIERERGAAMR